MATAFAGPLCRFFAAGDGDTARLALGVEQWQQDLYAALGDKPRLPQRWREREGEPAQPFDLGEAGLLALRLFAFYADRADLELPDRVPALLELDRHWRGAVDDRFARCLYAQILAPRLWLPGDFPFTHQDVAGVVGYSLRVGTDGRVKSCEVSRPSASARLDEATCLAIGRRARFVPHEERADRDRPAGLGAYNGTVRWELPD